MVTTSDTREARGRSPMRLVGIVLVAVILAVVAYGLFLWVKAGDPTSEQLAAQAAEQRLLEVVQAAPDGSTIDIAAVFDVPWDRAVLIPPYADAAVMNDLLGFEGFTDDWEGPSDESAQMIVFVDGGRVAWTIDIWNEDYQFADPFVAAFPDGAATFLADDATFVVDHTPNGIQLRPAP